jgi:hypothetical protein
MSVIFLGQILGGPDPKTSLHAGIFVNAEFAVPKRISVSVDLIRRLILEGKMQGTVRGPVELSSEVALGANPTLEVRDVPFLKKLEFGPTATIFLELGYEDKEASVKAGVTVGGQLTGHF